MNDFLQKISWPVNTDRLQLRRLEAADAQATWVYRQLPEVQRWITEGAENFAQYEGQQLHEERFSYDVAVLLPQASGEVKLIGSVMVKLEDGWGQAELRRSRLRQRSGQQGNRPLLYSVAGSPDRR